MRRVCRGFFTATLAALPLCGLVSFFEVTRPIALSAESLKVAALTSTITAAAENSASAKVTVVRFRGVSAELSAAQRERAEDFSTSDAARVFASLSSSDLCPGFESEFTSGNGRRMAVRIVGRDPVGEQIISGQDRVMVSMPASTAKLVSFVWGPWIYRAELEDRGSDAEIVVQKVL